MNLSKIDKEAIDKLFQDFNIAWALGDADAYANLFCEDATFIGAPGFRLKGRDIIRKEHQEMFDSIFKHSNINANYEKELEVLSADIVLVHTFGNVFFQGESGIGKQPNGIVTFCLIKKSDIWKITLFQNTPIGNFRRLKFVLRYLLSRIYLIRFKNK